MKIHPCQNCGACCASYRVSFHWMEADDFADDKGVPTELTVDLNDRYRCMKGTETKHSIKCCALQGRVGKFVSCSIYKNRSSTCRNFKASYENGYHQQRCDEARAKHGLKPLTKQDWISLEPKSELNSQV